MSRIQIIDPKEVIALVVLNLFTNIPGKATRIETDLPRVPLLPAPLTRAA